MIDGFYHPCLTVSDIDRSVAFYTDVIGMKIAWRNDTSSEAYQSITGLSGIAIRVVFLEMDGRYLELMQFTRGAGGYAGYNFNDVRAAHVSFFAQDVPHACQELKEKGVRFHTEPWSNENGDMAVFFYDPDSNMLELCTPPEGWRPTRSTPA